MSAKLLRGAQLAAEAFPWEPLSATNEGPVAKRQSNEAAVVVGSEVSTAPSPSEKQLAALRNELESLRQECAEKVESVRQQGLEEGKRAAWEEVRGERECMQKQLAKSLEETARARRLLLERTDEDLVRLAVAIAEKVLNRELHTDADALRGIARAALDRIAGKEVQVVRMHPSDQQAVEHELGATERQAMRLIADPSLPRGSLLFETEFGILDCSASTQLEEIERGLTDRIQRSKR